MKHLLIIALFTFGLMNCAKTSSESNQERLETLELSKRTADSLNAINEIRVADSLSTVAAQESGQLSSGSTSGSENAVATANTTPAAPAKKKWSNKKKGVVIGAASGAITGAVVSKKPVKGALIGTAVGGGVGLAAGAILDKKENNK